MSVSPVGSGSNTPYPYELILQARAAQAAKSAAALGPLGQEPGVGNSSQADSLTLTAASGMITNPGEGNRFATSMDSLGQSLQTGDLQGAQAAFEQIQQQLPPAGAHRHHQHHHHGASASYGAGSKGDSSPANPFAQAWDSLGQSLQSGDLAGAQSAFASLQDLFGASPARQADPGIGANSPAPTLEA